MLETVTRPLVIADLEAVARIHLRLFPYDGRSLLGTEVVRRWFERQMRYRSPIFANGAFDGATGELLAFCFGGLDGDDVQGFVVNNLPLLISLFLRRPSLVRHLGLGVRFREHVLNLGNALRRKERGTAAPSSPIPKKSYEIFSLGVMPEVQGLGLGKRLMVQQEARARDLACVGIRLQAPVEDADAIAFYERIGFRRVSETPTEGGAWRGEMEKRLTSAGLG